MVEDEGAKGNYWVMENPERDYVGIHRGSVVCVVTATGQGQVIVPVYGTGAFHLTNKPARWR